MEHVIKLKSGLDSLNKQECINIISSLSKDYITNLLFKYFNFRLNHAKSSNDINNNIVPEIKAFNTNITKIIISREREEADQINIIPKQYDDEEDEEDDDIFEAIQFNDLPSVMISVISSFLAFGDILNFEKCSKSVFIGTRSPISISVLPSSYSSKLIKYLTSNTNKNDSFYWNRFNKIEQFELCITDYFKYDENKADDEQIIEYQYNLNNIQFWNNLKILTISTSEFNQEFDSKFMSEFFKDLGSLQLHNVKTMVIEPFMSTDTMDSIFSQTISLEYVQLYAGWHVTRFPNTMKGYHIEDSEYETFDYISDNVKSLHLPEYQTLSDNGIKLNGLKEICLTATSQQEFNWINKQNLNDLERINGNFSVYQEEYDIDDELEKSMMTVFGALNVKYISIEVNEHMNKMIDVLCNSLNKISRPSMKIRIINPGYPVNQQSVQQINEQIYKLINILKTQTSDFMLIGEFSHIKRDDEINFDIFKHNFLVKSYVKNWCINQNWLFVISNKECRINGYKEKWLINCHFCQQNEICFTD